MENASILIVGGGIGGLTAAIALRKRCFSVDLVERDPTWSVYGVGIIQQANVLRAVDALGILQDYVGAGFAFDSVDIYLPNGRHAATIPSHKLVDGQPANLGIGRRALHDVLGQRAIEAGTKIRLGVTPERLDDDGAGVTAYFSDGTDARYDLVIGADGVYSQTRAALFPDAAAPLFTGQGVWRYNFARPAEVTSLHAFQGPLGIGLVPLSDALMYMFVTTPEPDNRRYEHNELASAMRDKLAGAPPAIAALAEQITDDDGVVYRPLEWLLVEGDWHKGRVVLLGDAVHATTPHLGQGAGMAIEDSLVLAEELSRAADPETAFAAYRARRFDRCAYIVRASVAICDGQLGRGPMVDQAAATFEMFQLTAQPI